MLENFTHREWVEQYEYSHRFCWKKDPNAGFSFSCSETGEMDTELLSECAKENFWRAIFDLFDEPLKYEGIVKRDTSYRTQTKEE